MSFSSRDTAPAQDAALVTPSDTGAISQCRALFVGGAGNLRVTTVRGTDLVLTGVPAGAILPLAVSRVWATNTTATNIAVLF